MVNPSERSKCIWNQPEVLSFHFSRWQQYVYSSAYVQLFHFLVHFLDRDWYLGWTLDQFLLQSHLLKFLDFYLEPGNNPKNELIKYLHYVNILHVCHHWWNFAVFLRSKGNVLVGLKFSLDDAYRDIRVENKYFDCDKN